MNLGQCGHLHRRPLQGTWIRALHPRFLANPLATAHSPTHATRFSPGTPADPAFEILYLAEDAAVALFEVQALLGSAYPGAVFVPNPAGGPWTLIDVQVYLQAVVDLTRRTSRHLLGTSAQELTGDWRARMAQAEPTSWRQAWLGRTDTIVGSQVGANPWRRGFPVVFGTGRDSTDSHDFSAQTAPRQPASLPRSDQRQLAHFAVNPPKAISRRRST